jgi:hypothetical protein
VSSKLPLALQEWLHWQMVSMEFARQQGMPLVGGIPDRFQ